MRATAIAVGLLLCVSLVTPANAARPVMRAVPGQSVVEAGQQFSIAIKVRSLRGPSSRRVCLFTKTEGRWRKLAACERVSVGRTFKLRVRLGGAAVGRNPYVVAPATARPSTKPPKTRSNVFRIRVLPPQ
jgi:hypothetical protein